MHRVLVNIYTDGAERPIPTTEEVHKIVVDDNPGSTVVRRIVETASWMVGVAAVQAKNKPCTAHLYSSCG